MLDTKKDSLSEPQQRQKVPPSNKQTAETHEPFGIKILGITPTKLVISNKSSGELSDFVEYTKDSALDSDVDISIGKTDTEMVYDKTDTEMIYDKTDTEMIYDKTDTEMIYDKTDTNDRTDTDLHAASEFVLDGSDTEATLETDISFHNDKSPDGKRAKGNSILKSLSIRNSGNFSDPYQSSDATKGNVAKMYGSGSSSSSDSDSPPLSEIKQSARDRGSTEKASEIATDKVATNGDAKVRSKGYETDEIGRTEDDFSVGSFSDSDTEKDHKPQRYSENEAQGEEEVEKEEEEGKDQKDPESDGVATEDDFSFASFDRNSGDEDEGELGRSNRLGIEIIILLSGFLFHSCSF